jgi:hypothetical protein
MKSTCLVLAGILLPLVSGASPVISDDGVPYYGSYHAIHDPYNGRADVAPGGNRDLGYQRAPEVRSFRSGEDYPPAPRSWAWDGDGYRNDDGLAPHGMQRPYRAQREEGSRSSYWGPDVEHYTGQMSDRRGGPYWDRPRGDGSGTRPYGYTPPSDRGGTEYGYPSFPNNPREARPPAAAPRYRFRGAEQAGEGPGAWWGGYQFRPLTDAEIQRLRGQRDGGPAPPGWPPDMPPAARRPASEGAFGYQPDGWLNR